MTEDREGRALCIAGWSIAIAGVLSIMLLVVVLHCSKKDRLIRADFDYAHRVSNLMNHWMLAEMSLVKLLKDENCGRETPPRAYPDLGSREQPSAPALDAQGNPIDLEPDGPDRRTPGDGSGRGRIQPRI